MSSNRRLRVGLLLALLVTVGGVVRGAEDVAGQPATVVEEWTVTLVDGATKEPLSGVNVEVNGAREGATELEVLSLTSDAVGEVKIPLPRGKATTVEICEPGWWLGIGALVGEFDIDQDGKFDGLPRTDQHPIRCGAERRSRASSSGRKARRQRASRCERACTSTTRLGWNDWNERR